MRRARKFFRLTSRERSLLVGSFVWVILYRGGLWVLPYRWTGKWTAERIGADGAVSNPEVVSEIVRSVSFASRYVPYASCLTQALAARRLLRRYGQNADLKIGVAKDNGNFEAHAWLEIDGRIVLGKQRRHSRYAVLEAS